MREYQNSEKIFLYITGEISLQLWSSWRAIWISIHPLSVETETEKWRERRREREGNREGQRWEYSLKCFIYFTSRIYLKQIMRNADTDLYKSISLFSVIYDYEIITLTLSSRIIGCAIAVCPNYGILY